MALIVALIGLVLLAVEAHVPTAGIVGGGGALALVAGAALALVAAGAGLAVTLSVALVGAALAAGSIVLVGSRIRAARRMRVRGGSPSLVGRLGVVRNWGGESGRIALDGALWRANNELVEAPEKLREGDRVVVNRVSGLTLRVRKAEDWEVLS